MQVVAGTAVTTTANFSVSGTPTDPTTITLNFRGGSGGTQTWVYGGAGSIIRNGTGDYMASLDTTITSNATPGTWIVEWTGTEDCAVVSDPSIFIVVPPQL